MELMPDWEDNIYKAFGKRRTKIISEQKTNALHDALEKYTGKKYVPKERTLKDKILFVLKLADTETEWTAKTMQNHLYFFSQKNFNESHIGKTLKKIAADGVLLEVKRGTYKKVA